MLDDLVTNTPGRLSILLAEGRRGHHLLFEAEEIRDAFVAEGAVITAEEADLVGAAILAVCREPLDTARATVEALPPPARLALVRLYFRLLDRIGGEAERH
jgi:hypothetical protein